MPEAARPSFADLFRLSVMMFFQYAIWGAWLPILWPYLAGHRHFSPGDIGWMFSVGAVGALVAPFVAGQIADRRFNTERFLGISHVVGGILVWQLASIGSFQGFLAFSLLYSLIYSPTLPLTNSLAFHHLPDRDRDFGRVRVWGTIGWIASGIAVGQWLRLRYLDADGALIGSGYADAFKLSGILGVVQGLYCFTLPKTPPSPGRQANATAEALGEVTRPPLVTLFLLAVPISCIHQFYFVHTSGFLQTFQAAAGPADAINRMFGVGGGGLMTIGQITEILVLAAIPLVAKKVSRKTLLATGIAAYAARMALFAHVQDVASALGVSELPVLILGVALHGFCFGCFIFVAFMVVDEETSADVRASAQSLFNLVIVGVGIIAGSQVASFVAEEASAGGTMDYRALFSVPMWASLACLAILLLFYPSRSRRNPA